MLPGGQPFSRADATKGDDISVQEAPSPDTAAKPSAARRIDLPRLTGLRAFAALSVFLCHNFEDFHWQPASAFRDGYSGVDFFFMLSGFVLTWSAAPRVGGLSGAMSFYRRRFARVWPTHAAVLAILYFVVHPSWPLYPFLFTIALIQAWNTEPIYAVGIGSGVAWSLSCEAAFYAVWPVIVRPVTSIAKRYSWLLVVVLYGVLLLVDWRSYAFTPNRMLLPYLFPPIRFVQFLAGVLLASAMQKGWRSPIPLPVTTLLLIIAVGCLRMNDWRVSSFPGLLLDPIFLLLLAGAAGQDMAGRAGWLRSRPLVYLGKVSFAFYLVHVSVMTYLAVRFAPFSFNSLQGVASCFAVSAVLAVLLHHFVETPFNRLLRPKHDKPVSS